MVVSLWRVRRTIWATAWAVYEPTGVLAYNELLAAKLIGMGRCPTVTIPHIWVDHPASITGGRALWDIPKQPATFAIESDPGAVFTATARTEDGQPIAEFIYRPRRTFPGRWPTRVQTRQPSLDNPFETAPTEAIAKAETSVEWGHGIWTIAPQGPFAFLAERKPFLTVRLQNCSLVFG